MLKSAGLSFMTPDEITKWLDEKILNYRFRTLDEKIDSKLSDRSEYAKGISYGNQISNEHFVNELRELKELLAKC